MGAIVLTKPPAYAPMTPTATNPPTVVLQSGTWGGNSTMARLTITIVSTRDVGGVSPSTLKYVIAQASGGPCYSGTERQNMTLCSGFTVNVAYLDTTTPGSVSPSDGIQISVSPAMNNPLIGGRLTVQTSDDRIMGSVNNL